MSCLKMSLNVSIQNCNVYIWINLDSVMLISLTRDLILYLYALYCYHLMSRCQE